MGGVCGDAWVGRCVRHLELFEGRGRGLLDRLVGTCHQLLGMHASLTSSCVYSRISGKQMMVIETQC